MPRLKEDTWQDTPCELATERYGVHPKTISRIWRYRDNGGYKP